MPAAFRLYSKLSTFYGLTGQALPGGYLKFYSAGTTTPKAVYGEEALTTNNGSQIALDASSRPEHDIWGSGSYFVELYDSDNVKQGEADKVQIPGGESQTVPVPEPGEYVTGDGINFLTAPIREVPDPTGHSNKILGTDGTTFFWVTRPADGADGAAGVSDVSNTATSFRVGTFRMQMGAATCPATGTVNTTVAVTFPTAFSAPPKVFIQASNDSNAGGPMVAEIASGPSTTGFTVIFTIAAGDIPNAKTLNPVPFDWVAFGPV